MTEPCRVCQGRKWIAPDVTQLTWFQQRYQWADLGFGVNDCPGCLNLLPDVKTTQISGCWPGYPRQS